jgi:hypothetical protein
MLVPDAPTIKVEGDNEAQTMARSGRCVALTTDRAMFRYGFRPGSNAAKAYGCHFTGDGFLWVILDTRTGIEVARYVGPASNFPKTFAAIWNTPFYVRATEKAPTREKLEVFIKAISEELGHMNKNGNKGLLRLARKIVEGKREEASELLNHWATEGDGVAQTPKRRRARTNGRK